MPSLTQSSYRGKELSKLGFLYIFLLAAITLSSAMEQQEVEQTLLKRNHVFANKLFQVISEEISRDEPKNIILSPLSLEIVLAVAGLGARGNTKSQLSSGINLPLELAPLKSRYTPLLNGLKDDRGCTIRIATQIFVEQDYPLKEEFVNASAEGFSCGTQSVQFVTNPDGALQTINSWAEQNTEGLIKNLLERSAINSFTRLVLTNAVYFKGKWAHQFNPTVTRKDKFHLVDGSTVDVDMMHIEERFRFGHPEGLNAKVLELPYQGDQLSMVILLPDPTSSLAELEGKVSAEAFDLDGLLTNHTYPIRVDVTIPKFKIEMTADLVEPLKKLGMIDMFSDSADFSGITSSVQGLKVSKVVQKAFIEVTEEGTEAAAATAMIFNRSRPRVLHRETFRADRPYIFIIAEKQNWSILFFGTCGVVGSF